MIRPGLAFLLWLALVAFVLLNGLVGDMWLAPVVPVRVLEWYKVVVPLPYVAMLAIIHARRTAGPAWLAAALVAALLWPVSTLVAEFLFARFLYDSGPEALLDRLAFWWGAPYPLFLLALFVAPLAAGLVFARRKNEA